MSSHLRSSTWKYSGGLVWFAFLACGGLAHGKSIVVTVDSVPESGIVVGHVNLTAAAKWCQLTPMSAGKITAKLEVAPSKAAPSEAEHIDVPAQFIPDFDYDPAERLQGTLVLKLPASAPARVRLEFGAPQGTASPASIAIKTSWYEIFHDPQVQAGMPSRIQFPGGKSVTSLNWQNRLYHRERGPFVLTQDQEARIEQLGQGPLCDVVRIRGRFVQGKTWPDSRPETSVDWYYFRDEPVIRVETRVVQRDTTEWHEVHSLELDYPGEIFPQWSGGAPLREGRFTGTRASLPQTSWGVVHDGRAGIGMFHAGQVLLYDGGPGTYIQAHGDMAWRSWSGREWRTSQWVWLGESDRPADAVELAARQPTREVSIEVGIDDLQRRIDDLHRANSADVDRRRHDLWKAHAAQQLASAGRFADAVSVLDGNVPSNLHLVSAGDLQLLLDSSNHGIRVLDLLDSLAGRRLVTNRPLPLWRLQLRHSETRELLEVDANSGWQKCEVIQPQEGTWELIWSQPDHPSFQGLEARLRATGDEEKSALSWSVTVSPPAAPWALWRVHFPEIAVAELDPSGTVFYPQAAGIAKPGAWRESFRFSGKYPSGWTTMQFMAAYDGSRQTGLYVGVHDPRGSTKDLLVESHPSQHEVVLAFDHPIPDMGRPGTRFELTGSAVWQLLRGDWFDASVIYRDWVRREASWYPRLEAGQRPDTPEWLRTNAVWALSGGTAAECVPGMEKFAQILERPMAVHWYNWHQIPFDNDYPHYFPVKEGFSEGVSTLQRQDIAVMPYINGRLWDTHDRGSEDFQFSTIARPAVSKDEQGEPYLESYSSKEADGSSVRLGVMCPSTDIWRNQVRDIVRRLFQDYSVRGVYIDQVAAAAPTLCFDASHGHPLGGGHWWVDGYTTMLETIRREMPADRALTTECNGEPFLKLFDGYLTWHWQYEHQVPAFSAIYGGAIAMFGRSYGGGPTRDLAFRMKTGQALVFGEQLGWINPAIVNEAQNAEFLKRLVQLRRQLTPYFVSGEMARPPGFSDPLPTVRADWQWNGEHWVTTDRLLAGAWIRPTERKLVIVFVNVGNEPLTSTMFYDLRPYGFKKETLVQRLEPAGRGETFPSEPIMRRTIQLNAGEVGAWEVTDSPSTRTQEAR